MSINPKSKVTRVVACFWLLYSISNLVSGIAHKTIDPIPIILIVAALALLSPNDTAWWVLLGRCALLAQCIPITLLGIEALLSIPIHALPQFMVRGMFCKDPSSWMKLLLILGSLSLPATTVVLLIRDL